MSLTKVVLIGATGNIGSIILSSLLASPALTITILTRETSTATFPPSPNLKVIKRTYTLPSLIDAFKGQDAIICAVGAAGLGDQKLFIDAAIEAGVERFMPSEFSVNTQSETVRELVPLFEIKYEVLRYLKEREESGLTWTALGVGLLFDWGLQSGFLGFDIANRSVTLWDQGQNVFSLTNQKDMGDAVVSILSKPKETANQYLYVATVTTSQEAILESLEKESGQIWAKRHVKTADQVVDARAKLAKGDFSGAFTLVQASAYGKVAGIRANYEVDEVLANKMLDLKTGSVDETMKRVLESLC